MNEHDEDVKRFEGCLLFKGWRHARKLHFCGVCGSPICKGEEYFTTIVLDEDRLLFQDKACKGCHRVS